MGEKPRKRVPKRLDEAGLRDYAMRLLSARGYSISEMRLRLRRRAASAGDADHVLEKLVDSGLMDDQRLAESYARARLENQGHGRQRVLSDLRRRRVPASIADSAVEEIYRDTDESEQIERFLRRKFRGVSLSKHFSEPKNVASAYRRLRYAGFSAGNAIRILKRYSEQAEELESMEEGGLIP